MVQFDSAYISYRTLCPVPCRQVHYENSHCRIKIHHVCSPSLVLARLSILGVHDAQETINCVLQVLHYRGFPALTSLRVEVPHISVISLGYPAWTLAGATSISLHFVRYVPSSHMLPAASPNKGT